MKKAALVFLSLILVISAVSCKSDPADNGASGTPSPSSSEAPAVSSPVPSLPPADVALEGDGLTVLDNIIEGAKVRFDRFPYCMTEDILSSEIAPNYLGITSEEIGSYLSGAWISNAVLMGGGAYQVAMVTVKNAADAETVAGLIRAGFNPHRWVCEAPALCDTLIIGSHIFLIAGRTEEEAAILEEISLLTGIAVEDMNLVNFFVLDGNDSGGGGGLMF